MPEAARHCEWSVPWLSSTTSLGGYRKGFSPAQKSSALRVPPVAAEWYNRDMMNFGKGPTLKEASPWLRDDQSRIERILTITETDSVIEGLPPFQAETRERLRQQLTSLAAPAAKPAE
jgi:hypothetical protein